MDANALRKLPLTVEDEFGVSCRDCRYSRKHGAAPLKASRDGRRHSLANPDHRVRITRTVTVAEWTMNDGQAVLDDEPPF